MTTGLDTAHRMRESKFSDMEISDFLQAEQAQREDAGFTEDEIFIDIFGKTSARHVRESQSEGQE